MKIDDFNRRCDLYAINSRIHRTTALAGAGLMIFIGLLGWFVLAAEQQLKREALINQEQVVWK